MSDERPQDTDEPTAGGGALAVHDQNAISDNQGLDLTDTVVVPLSGSSADVHDTAVFAAPEASTRVSGLPAPGATGYDPYTPYPQGDLPGFEPPLFGAPEAWDAPPEAPTRQRTGGTGKVVAIAVASGLLAGLVGGVGGYTVAENRSASSLTSAGTTIPQTDADLSARPSGSIAAVAAAVLPTVVQIEETSSSGSGTGSGFILRADGYILTNNHVVEGAAKGGTLTVRFQDGTTVPAKIVGRDTSYDLAVVKVDKTGLPVATLGNSDGIVVGDSTIAVGSPLGLEGTVTAGIVSALNRPVTAGGSGESSFINAIQTDAAINPGNSGGPLLDAQGKVIGVNSAIASLSQGAGQAGSIGLGFSIPINQAKRVAEEIISTGTSTHPIIGVQVDSRYNGNGAQISGVTDGGPAAAAGIKAGDVIVDVNGRAVSDSTELIVAIRTYAPGDTITIGIKDGTGVRNLDVVLGSDTSSG